MSEQPINILIFAGHFVNHVGNGFILLSFSASLAFDYSIRQMIEEVLGDFVESNTYCWTFFYVYIFMIGYSAFEGFGIAVVRLLYIKKGSWLKYKYGEKRFIIKMGLLTAAFAAFMTALFGLEDNSNRSAYNICTGYSQKFQVTLLNNFRFLPIFFKNILQFLQKSIYNCWYFVSCEFNHVRFGKIWLA